ncbi:unnamed protein product [Aureobasidium uvarum]|uniref:BRCT domain-containing protein n=1 Tax=Aureobasidium uvarum TaxID=2773716 RepID=A0A9N8KSQ4_9PEZI|nr:unnamed protein product [Aureobasidium uvarum]
MVATRAMAAKKAPDDKENDNQLALRKKPVRRATAKAPTTATKASTSTKPAQSSATTTSARSSATTSSANVSAPAARPKRQTRAAAAPPPDPAPQKAPATRRKPALPEVARGKALRSRKVEAEPEQEPGPDANEEEAEEHEPIASPPPSRVKALRSNMSEKISDPEPEQETDSESVAEPESISTVVEEEDEDVEDESEVKQAETPKPREPGPKQQEPDQDACEEEEAEDADGNSSEDEICGPKTPMRRTTRSQAAPRTVASSTTARKLQTPARQFLSHRTNQGTPQTQRMPHNATRTSSPPRPMTVARGADKKMVFRPLKQQISRHTPVPVTSDHHSDTDMTEEDAQGDTETELEESSADELDDQLDSLQQEAITIMPTPAHTIQFEAVDGDSEDELAGTGGVLEDQDDDLEEDTVVDFDDKKEPEYVPAGSHAEDDVSDDEDTMADDSHLDDSTLPEPQFSADFTTSVPSSPASIAEEPPQIEIEDSELLSSPAPSTPASVIERDLVSPTQEIAPASRLSLDDNDLLSLIDDQEATTPHAMPRVSFSTATAKMLQTPRMQFALGGIDATEADDSPSVTANEPSETDIDQTVTINPSLLEVDDFGVKLATNLENAAAIPTPYFATPAAGERLSMGFPKERMSLLQDDIFNLVDFDHVSPVKTDVRSPISDPGQVEAESMELSTPGYNTRRQSYHPKNVSIPSEQVQSDRRSSFVSSGSPSYARSTFAFDSRRKSLPAATLHTPMNGDLRPRTAETSIKPITSDSFAKLWASKQRRSSVRKSLLEHTIPDLAEIHSFVPPAPSSTRKRDSTPAQRRTSTVHFLENPVSPHVPFSGAKPRRHTPSSSSKLRIAGRSPFKTRSSSRSPIKMRSPMKLRDASRSPVKRLREAPRTPMKTPLKAAGLATPAVYPMTPHPLQPLKSVTALVEVFTLDGSSASGPFIALLQGLGARTTKSWSDRVTHVVFKDGSPTTLQRVRVSNKDPNGKKIFCVNSRWVTDCERHGTRMDEQADIYVVDLDEVPRGGRRRRKSMEPAALKNVDGNIVHSNNSSANSSANRKSVGTRQSIVGGRQSINLARANKALARVSLASSFWGDDSPVKKTPGRKQARDSWDDDEEMADAFFDEPTAKFEVPTSLGVNGASLEAGQMTAPVDRVKKLRIRDEDNRRLTFMGGRG